jgi:glycosyltransferase involved in cell wall biosynthesis
MRIVVFSNLFPPLFLGGYELGAAGVARELRRRGHEVLVLSAHGYYMQQGSRYVRGRRGPDWRGKVVDTGLCVFGSLAGLLRREPIEVVGRLWQTLRSRRRYRQVLADFRPDAFLMFNPGGAAAPVIDDCAELARDRRVPLAAYVSDHWLAEWPAAHPVWHLLRRLRAGGGRLAALADGLLCRWLGSAGLLPHQRPAFSHYFYCSDFIRRASAARAEPRAEHHVVPWGLAGMGERAAGTGPDFVAPGPLELVYAGQIVEHKGLMVLLEALARCRRPHRLTVVGGGVWEYEERCRRLAAERGLGGRVRFLGKRRHGEMAGLLAEAQALVAPSLWDEPFSLVVLEGLAAGLAVIASDAGGTPEAVEDGVNGVLFPRGDAGRLAEAIDRLDADRPLCRRLADEGRRAARERFALEGMVDRLLAALDPASARAQRQAA